MVGYINDVATLMGVGINDVAISRSGCINDVSVLMSCLY